MTMENPSTCLKANSAALSSEANVVEKTLAVTQLYERFRRRIYAHIYRLLGSREDADDVMQEYLCLPTSPGMTWMLAITSPRGSTVLPPIYALICYDDASASPVGLMSILLV